MVLFCVDNSPIIGDDIGVTIGFLSEGNAMKARSTKLRIDRRLPVLVAGMLLAAAGSFAQPVDSETCLQCHDDKAQTLRHGPHRLSLETTSPAVRMECVSCHGGGEAHIEDPSADNIGNPPRMAAAEVQALCETCHQPHMAGGTVGFDPHIGLDLNCTSCHTVHAGNEQLLADPRADFCGSCHVAVVNQFQLVSNHPLTGGNVTCLSCHDFTGSKEPAFGHGGTANCIECHPQQSGPYIHEHGAVSSFTTEGDGCTACHTPHGSHNDRLLNEPDERLCKQCHGLPPLHRTQHNGLAMQYGCLDCHSEVHGSDDNAALLDPQLGTKIGGQAGSCFCHNVRD